MVFRPRHKQPKLLHRLLPRIADAAATSHSTSPNTPVDAGATERVERRQLKRRRCYRPERCPRRVGRCGEATRAHATSMAFRAEASWPGLWQRRCGGRWWLPGPLGPLAGRGGWWSGVGHQPKPAPSQIGCAPFPQVGPERCAEELGEGPEDKLDAVGESQRADLPRAGH